MYNHTCRKMGTLFPQKCCRDDGDDDNGVDDDDDDDDDDNVDQNDDSDDDDDESLAEGGLMMEGRKRWRIRYGGFLDKKMFKVLLFFLTCSISFKNHIITSLHKHLSFGG